MRLSKLDEGAPDAQMQIVNLGEIAKEAAERMRPLAEKQGIALAVEGDDSLVTGARALLEEMVRNLVDNAIKYNVERVACACRSKWLPDGGRHGHRRGSAGSAEIFERFYRVDKSRSREAGGTGLGLSIVKHIAQLHSAQISLTSELGKGTKISVRFP